MTGHLTDDLSKVLDDATWNDDQTASAGTVQRAGDLLTWSGPLAVGQTVTIRYSVTVTGDGDQRIANVVTSPDGTAACVPAADGNPGCATEHTLTDPPAPGRPGDPYSDLLNEVGLPLNETHALVARHLERVHDRQEGLW